MNNLYKEPKTYLQYIINYCEANKEVLQSRNLKETDLKELQSIIKSKLGLNYSLGELWSTCIYVGKRS